MLTFEVIDFSRLYHIFPERTCYIKFMAIPSYAYLKLKIVGLADVITEEAKAQWVLDCERNNIELVIAIVTATELRDLCPAPSRRPRMPGPCKLMPRT
jgi:hypothetical protein